MTEKTNYIYSANDNAFFPTIYRADYERAGSWPVDGVDVTDSVFYAYSGLPPKGKIRRPGDDGMPSWVDAPAKSKDELIAEAERYRQVLIAQANEYMNSKQWPGKAGTGRLKGDELARYNLWLDYLDALEEIDTSTAPDMKWPAAPQI
ncbi:tail fiber assembly protein [Yokenella regensburgei]|uniref:tail fiber assembly protein n=1 Tax=Yokenella regensburgei TaxID=158877 RepID=UPI003EDB0982